MKIHSITPNNRIIQIEADLDELGVLYDATRRGRRSDKEQATLERFGDAMLDSDPSLKEWITQEEAPPPPEE